MASLKTKGLWNILKGNKKKGRFQRKVGKGTSAISRTFKKITGR